MSLTSLGLYKFGPFELKVGERVLLRRGKDVRLPRQQFELLELLVSRFPDVVTRKEMLLKVWNEEVRGDTDSANNKVDTAVSQLREAMGRNYGDKYIQTRPKVGYQFKGPVEKFPKGDVAASPLPVWTPIRLAILVLITSVIVSFSALFIAWYRVSRPSESDRLYAAALKYEVQGDDELALTALEQLIRSDSSYAPAYMKAAFLAYDLEQTDRANKLIISAKRLASAQPAIYGMKLRALELSLADNNTEALKAYQLVADQFPSDQDGLFIYGEYARDMGELDQSNTAFTKCLKLDSKNPFCNYGAMLLDVKRSNFESVLQRYREVRRMGVEYVWLEEPVALALIGLDRPNDALVHLEQLAEPRRAGEEFRFITSRKWLADVFLYEGRIHEGTTRLNELTESALIGSDKASQLAYLAEVEVLLADKKNSRTHANQALPLSPSPTALTNISIVLAIAGDSKGTESALSSRKEEERASKPSSTHFIIGMQALQAGHTDKAISELELSREFSEEDIDVSYWLADTYSKAGRCEAAVPLFKSILHRKGDVLLDYSPLIWPLSHYSLALCSQKLGKSQDSNSYYAKFLELWRNGDIDNEIRTRALNAYRRQSPNKQRDVN